MKRNSARRLFPVLPMALAFVGLVILGSISCGGRWAHKSTVFVGTSDPQQAFYATLIAVNAYHYPFAQVDASSGHIVTGQMDLGNGRWYSFDIRVLPSGEVQIDPVTNMEKTHQGGVVIPRGVLNRANNIGRYVRKVFVEKSPQEIAAQGEQIHQSVLQGLAMAPTPPSGG